MNPMGHLRTVSALVGRRIGALEPPSSQSWSTVLEDRAVGPVRLTGRLSPRPGDRLLVAVHGLGGSADSRYLWQLANAAVHDGWSVLRLNLRGADRSGDDFYHGGLTADLHATLADPGLAHFSDIAVVGYSLGGHMVLRWATEGGDPRVRAVAALCPPLDLAAGQAAIDRPGAMLYRGYLLRHLREIFRAASARRAGPIPAAEAERIRTLLEWDDRIVAPRHGYGGAADYYASASVAPRLRDLRLPALVVATTGDPMVPVATVERHLATARTVDTRWVRGGGHVAFPRELTLGIDGETGLERQVLAWLRQAITAAPC